MRLNYGVRNWHRVAAVCNYNLHLFHKPRGLIAAYRFPSFQPPNLSTRFKATLYAQSSMNNSVSSRILKKIGWFAYSRVKLRRGGYYLYESIADQLDYLPFFKEFELDDTYFSWFLITELHVWMLLVRVMTEGEEGRFVRNSIIEAMWEDVSTRAKQLGGVSTSVLNEQKNELSEQFQAAIIGYDEGILSEDRVLAAAIWRRFFKQEFCNPEKIECLVRYIRQQIKLLDELPFEKMLSENSISWIPLEHIQDAHLR